MIWKTCTAFGTQGSQVQILPLRPDIIRFFSSDLDHRSSCHRFGHRDPAAILANCRRSEGIGRWWSRVSCRPRGPGREPRGSPTARRAAPSAMVATANAPGRKSFEHLTSSKSRGPVCTRGCHAIKPRFPPLALLSCPLAPRKPRRVFRPRRAARIWYGFLAVHRRRDARFQRRSCVPC